MIKFPANFNKSVASDFDGIFEWDYLKDIFPRGIMPMDWDGVVEINKKFLILETKDVGKAVPKGQLWALQRATMVGPFFVIIIWGKKNPKYYQLIQKGELKDLTMCNKEDIQALCRKWVEWAEKY